jgi:hypothetical protein
MFEIRCTKCGQISDLPLLSNSKLTTRGMVNSQRLKLTHACWRKRKKGVEARAASEGLIHPISCVGPNDTRQLARLYQGRPGYDAPSRNDRSYGDGTSGLTRLVNHYRFGIRGMLSLPRSVANSSRLRALRDEGAQVLLPRPPYYAAIGIKFDQTGVDRIGFTPTSHSSRKQCSTKFSRPNWHAACRHCTKRSRSMRAMFRAARASRGGHRNRPPLYAFGRLPVPSRLEPQALS